MRKFIVLTLSAMLLAFAAAAAVAGPSLKAESLNFAGAQEDQIGKRGGSPDGTKDAEFTIAVSGAQAIQSITLRNETTGKEWSSSDRNNFLLVKNAKGEAVNAGGRMTPVPVLLVTRLTLVVNDAARAIPEDSKFTAVVQMIGGETSSVSAEAAAVRGAKRPNRNAAEGEAAVNIFEAYGVSKQDLVGAKERAGGDGSKDYRIDVRFKLPDGVKVEGLKLEAANGGAGAQWDTVKGSGAPLIAVTKMNDNKMLNKQNGSVSLAGGTKYRLFVEDKNGILKKSGTKLTLNATLSDGRLISAETGAKAGAAANGGGNEAITAKYTGAGKYDFAGQKDKPAANMNPDSFIELSVNGAKSKITGISVTNEKSGKTWDTVPGNDTPCAVVLGGSMSSLKKLNAADGSVSLAPNAAKKLFIAIDENKGRGEGQYTVRVLFEDGRLAEVKASK